MNLLAKLSQWVNRRVEAAVVVTGAAMTGIVVVQVFFRYVLNMSLFWSEELARYLLVWMTFLGASVAYYHGVHPGVDAVFSRMSPWLKKISTLVVHGASLFLFGIMVISGIEFAWFVRLQISPALAIPKWIILAIVPISGLVLMIHGICFLIRDLKGDAP